VFGKPRPIVYSDFCQQSMQGHKPRGSCSKLIIVNADPGTAARAALPSCWAAALIQYRDSNRSMCNRTRAGCQTMSLQMLTEQFAQKKNYDFIVMVGQMKGMCLPRHESSNNFVSISIGGLMGCSLSVTECGMHRHCMHQLIGRRQMTIWARTCILT
jgi:hypothetical protein